MSRCLWLVALWLCTTGVYCPPWTDISDETESRTPTISEPPSEEISEPIAFSTEIGRFQDKAVDLDAWIGLADGVDDLALDWGRYVGLSGYLADYHACERSEAVVFESLNGAEFYRETNGTLVAIPYGCVTGRFLYEPSDEYLNLTPRDETKESLIVRTSGGHDVVVTVTSVTRYDAPTWNLVENSVNLVIERRD